MMSHLTCCAFGAQLLILFMQLNLDKPTTYRITILPCWRCGRVIEFCMSTIIIYVDMWSAYAFKNARQFVDRFRLLAYCCFTL